MTSNSRRAWVALVSLLSVLGCTPVASTPPPVDANNHRFFPIGPGTGHALGSTTVEGEVTCESCHRTTAGSLADVHCDACHKHPDALIPQLHLGVPDAGFPIDVSTLTDPIEQSEKRSAQCASCHPTGTRLPFSHTGVMDQCGACHAPGNSFAALPRAGFMHVPPNPTECRGCHQDVTNWANASNAGGADAFDPARSVNVTALSPTFTGPVIVRVSPLSQSLPMPMNHATGALDAGLLADCFVCHSDSASDTYYPGVMHSSLAGALLPQPTQCAGCHSPSRPLGFVGPLATQPARSPPTGAMRHEAVAWNAPDGGPGLQALVPGECALCHRTPDDSVAAGWSTGQGDAGAPVFHASLTAASLAQPSSCLDCHANSRPTTVLTSMNAAVPMGMSFDHSVGPALGECTSCHASTSRWAPGLFHGTGVPTPATCLPCHASERPTSTTGWQSTTFTRSPFDYGRNAQNIGHGGDEDCAVCHSSSTSTWVGGHFPHGAGTLAETTCSSCHTTQRPTMVVQSFNHTLNGTGECRACHRATVTAGRYVDYFNPSTGTLPGGDWQGGREYPGDALITSPTQFITVPALRLNRNTSNFVTGVTTQQLTFFNAMLHTSSVIPAQLAPGPVAMPDMNSCWHCHTHTNGTVTEYVNGKYHSALTTYSATPGGTVSAIAQPTSQCVDCHEQMRPNLIVQKSGSALQTMDHSATFTMQVTIGGRMVTGVPGLDCSTCHRAPGTTWGDGVFHANIGTATPSDCVSCHYPLSTTAQADVTSSTTFAMKHRSPQLTLQRCNTCHTSALSRATMAPLAATQWRTGALHANALQQPSSATCLECHSPSEPAMATQSTVTWTFTGGGGTSTNGAQWMSHTVTDATSRDCSACHTDDAKASGSMWKKSTSFHAHVATPGACAGCHGTGNGRGTTLGTNNNVPSGLSTTNTTTTSSASPGVKDQISHADLNVTARDCGVCHTQKGVSTTQPGQEWRQAQFHARFTSAAPLVMNTTTGRCSNCHFNLKPGPAFTAFDHSTYTATSGTPDCSSCHSWPGTGTATAPNWLGAAAMPAFISVGGFTIPQPPAAAAGVIQTGIANLPHPPVATGVACTTCHALASGGRRAFGYPHTNTLINSNCNSCHEAGTDLIGTVWNGSTTTAGGAGDSRPIGITSLVPTFKGNTRACTNQRNHFFPVDCKECHSKPAGNGFVTTGTAYTAAWRFKHSEGAPMTKPATCNLCHNSTASGGCSIPK